MAGYKLGFTLAIIFAIYLTVASAALHCYDCVKKDKTDKEPAEDSCSPPEEPLIDCSVWHEWDGSCATYRDNRNGDNEIMRQCTVGKHEDGCIHDDPIGVTSCYCNTDGCNTETLGLPKKN